MSIKRVNKIRRQLDQDFKPLFDMYDEDGLPMQHLFDVLKTSTLPSNKIWHFIRTADRNQNGQISYDEFLQEMIRVDSETYRYISMSKRVLSHAVVAIAPGVKFKPIRMPVSEVDAYNWGEVDDLQHYYDTYNCKPPPIFIPLITIVEICVFVYYALRLHHHSTAESHVMNESNVASGWDPHSVLVYNPCRRREVWRFLSYALIHNGFEHLIFNCLLQLILGTLLEIVHKYWRVAIVYILGVLAGSLAHSVTDPMVYLVGASGGCYALMGAHIATAIMNWQEMQTDWLKTPINFVSSAVFAITILLFLAGGDTGLAAYSRFTNEHATRVGFAAHGGGFVAGFLLGVPVLRNFKIKRWEKVCFWISLLAYCALTFSVIVINFLRPQQLERLYCT